MGVGSLDALAEVAIEDNEAGILDVENWNEAVLCPMDDARRMEVYTRLFDASGKALGEVSAEVVTEHTFADVRRNKQLIIFGNGAAKCREVMPDATYINITPSARGLARLAQLRLTAGQTEDIAYFEPFYLKDFIVIPSKKKLL